MATNATGGAAPAKRSASETGHARNVASFGTLLAFLRRYQAGYNPSREALTLKALEQRYQDALKAIDTCKQQETAFDNATDARRQVFRNLQPLCRRVVGALKASGADGTVIEGAMTISRKLQGQPSPLKKKEALATGTGAAGNTISSSQRSYVQLVQHFSGLRELVASRKEYQPNEKELSVEQLHTFQQQMQKATETLDSSLSGWSGSRIARDKALYETGNGLIDIAAAVKEYIKSVYGPTSAEYKEVKGIPFKTRRS